MDGRHTGMAGEDTAWEDGPARRQTGAEDRRWRRYLPFAVAGLILGVIIWGAVPVGGDSGTVAVIPVEGGIDGESAVEYAAALERATADPAVGAVVLLVNSPGGTASASETMYLETRRATEGLPVVASVDAQAASGAYYTIAPADHIYAKPSSLVGSVGVLFTPPPEVEPTADIVATGPNKLAGADQRGWYYKTEALQEAFLSAVVTSRGDALNVSREQIATAQLFTGAGAVRAGLADDIGGTRAAIRKAASMAGLGDYSVRVIRPGESTRFITRSNYLASNATNKTMASAQYFLGPPEARFPNYLMLPAGVVETAMVRGPAANATTPREVTNASE